MCAKNVRIPSEIREGFLFIDKFRDLYSSIHEKSNEFDRIVTVIKWSPIQNQHSFKMLIKVFHLKRIDLMMIKCDLHKHFFFQQNPFFYAGTQINIRMAYTFETWAISVLKKIRVLVEHLCESKGLIKSCLLRHSFQNRFVYLSFFL